MAGLDVVVKTLATEKIAGDLWVNGSFLTQKLEPADADILLRVDGVFFDTAATPTQQAAVNWVASNLKASHLCDSYAVPRYPVGHPHYWVGETMYAYWLRQFGMSRADSMKGLALIELGKVAP